MGNKQGHELSPEEKLKLKEEKEREKKLIKEEKERRKREKKEEKRRKKEKKRGKDGVIPEVGEEDEDAESVGGSSQWSEKSQGSAPGSWYHSASEPSSKRSSIYLPASAGPGYYQHDCWYSGYEDSGSEKSKPPSRTTSVKDTLNIRAASLERYPLGVPTGEPIEPLHKAGSLDLTSAVAKSYLKEREKRSSEDDIAATVASRYDETIRTSRDHLERAAIEKVNLFDKIVSDRTSVIDRVSLNSSVYHSAEEGSIRGEKRKASVEGRGLLSAEEGVIGSNTKRQSLDYTSDHTSVTGSIYYSADEGGSIAGSVYYSATSGSEVEDHGDDTALLGKDRPSAPGKPEAVDREGSALSRLAYIKVENDALLLRWDQPVTDGGSPITGYIIERSEGQGEMWVRVNLVPIKDTEYAVANLIGGREYRFRVSAENAVGMSDPSPPSEIVSISTDQEATEPHFLRELRDAIAVESQRVEFSVDIIGTPLPDITWYKDGFEVYDTRRFEFRVEGDRYTLVLKEAKLTDEGDIRVRATNRVGVASSQATLRVEAPPQVRLPPQYEQGLIFDTDELIRLRVPYTGRPQPQAAWTHNGKEIASDDRHTMDVSDKYITLKIAGACRTDKGMYTLKLSNSQGNETSSFFVTVTDRPDAPSLPTITDVSGTSVTLRWDPPLDDGGCRISNYIVEYFRVGWDVWLKAASSRITWTQLSDLIVGSEYRFRVKAENAYGVSEPGEESDKILFEEAKSPTGYENLGTNGGMFIPNCDQGSAPERGLVGTPVDIQELSAQSGMIIESVSLKSSQSQYEELLRLQLRRLETFYSDNDDSENDDTLIQEVSGEEDFSSSDTETCMSELMEDRFPFLSSRSGTLSLDQSTTSLLGPLSPYFIHPSRLLGSVSLWTELGIVSGGLTPAHYLGTIRGISSDSDHTGTMNSPSTESCCTGQNFVATTHVYHSWTTPSNSPLTHNLQAAAEEEVFADDERSPTNTELLNMDEAAMGHYLWTGRNESPVADHVEADTCTNMAVNQQMSLSTPTLRTPDDEVKISNQLVRIAAEDGSPSYQRGWGRGEAAMIDQAVSNGSDSGSDNCAIMDVYNEGVTASRVMRSFCNEAASANLAMRDVQNEGMPANQVMRGVYNEGMPANQVMRGVHNEGMPANQVMRGVFNEETAANQVMRDFYNEGTAANEDLAVGQVTGSVRNATPTYEKFMRSYEAAAANQEIKNFSCGEPSVPQVGRYISDEGDGRSEVSRVEDGRTPGSEGDIDSEINSVENEVTAAGGQWTTRGRIAIANQFRIICGGLASMTHLGNLSTKRRTSHNEDGSSDRSGKVEDDDSSCNYSTTTQNSKSSFTSLDTESSERDLEDQYRQVVSDTPPANQKGFFSLGGSAVNILRGLRMEKSAGNQQDVRKQQLIPISEQNTSGEKKVDVNHRENMNRKGTAVSGATHDGNVVEIKPFNYYKSVISRHTAALNENKAHAAEIMEYGDTADSEGSVKNNTVIEAHRQSSSLQSEAAANTIQERGSRSVRRKEKPSRATTFERSSDPVFNIGPISSTSTQNSECGDSDHLTENSLSISNQDFDELSSWEPKINKEITTRIDLLEDLVYRCLENEDVTMNTLGVSDNEGSASPSPLAVLSPVSCGARVDVRRGELKDLISDLGELVSSMNEKSRTLSAENVAKFFEKTASVVRDHSQSPAVHLTGDQADSSRHSSLHSSRTHSLSEVEWLIDDLNHSSNPENKGNIIKPYDQVHIQSSILNRITYLDDVMNRCLENEDVTLNTLGSPAVSPPPVPSAQPKEKRIDASKIELKDLIGNLGSMVDDLGQKFNAYFPE